MRFIWGMFSGSSPHAWGPRRVLPDHGLAGIIPTRVGTTCRWRYRRSPPWDHPHTRGDHASSTWNVAARTGSSPHAWGPLQGLRGRRGRAGIIPTRVGTTIVHPARAACFRDHPHTRGDHRYRRHANWISKGSSPHAWGPPSARASPRPCTGIIPTRVGTTEPRTASTTTSWDHPHTRGDHPATAIVRAECPGSSPHAWGPLHGSRPYGHGVGDHPHTRGDHVSEDAIVRAGQGSSPHAWGPREHGDAVDVGGWDHPHTRGDHPYGQSVTVDVAGSSPHAWGPPCNRAADVRVRGSSPHAWGPLILVRLSWEKHGDHPHTRGDHHSDTWDNPLAQALTSHTRGDHWTTYQFDVRFQGSSPRRAWGPLF